MAATARRRELVKCEHRYWSVPDEIEANVPEGEWTVNCTVCGATGLPHPEAPPPEPVTAADRAADAVGKLHDGLECFTNDVGMAALRDALVRKGWATKHNDFRKPVKVALGSVLVYNDDDLAPGVIEFRALDGTVVERFDPNA